MQGAVIFNSINGHFYVAQSGGQSGPTMPAFPVATKVTVAEPAAGGVMWRDLGTKSPPGAPSSIPQWAPNSSFAAGQLISPGNGHLYIVQTSGQSGTTMPVFPMNGGTVADGPTAGTLPLTWTDAGTSAPPGVASPFALWAPNKQFPQGSVILNQVNGHFYTATIGGQSGATMPAFPMSAAATVSESAPGAILWEDVGTTAPPGVAATVPQWTPNTTFTARSSNIKPG